MLVEFVGSPLGKPDDPPIVTEVGVTQVGEPVESELDEHRSRKGLDKEIRQEIRPGFGVEVCLEPIRTAGVQVVAVQAGKSPDPQSRADVVERTVRAAIGVPDGDRRVRLQQRAGEPLDLAGDPLGPVVQQWRQGVDVDLPAPPR